MAQLSLPPEVLKQTIFNNLVLPLFIIQIIVVSSLVVRFIAIFVQVSSLWRYLLTAAIYAFHVSFHRTVRRLLVAIPKEFTRDGPRTLDTFFIVERNIGMILCVIVFVGAYTPLSTYFVIGKFILSNAWRLLRSRVHGYVLLNKGSFLDLLQVFQSLLFRSYPPFMKAAHQLHRITKTIPERYKNRVLLPKLGPRFPFDDHKDIYIYKPLSYKREIRLLRLQPCLFSFKATLVPALLDNPPPFDSISYTWGDPFKTHELTVDGRLMRIPKSTADIIRQRTSLWRCRTLWIDAICIDQDNTDDKNQQVAMMRDIYNAAERTIVCLGDGPDGKVLFNFFDQLVFYENFYNPDEQELKSTKLIKEENPKWLALKGLLNHTYWKRAWVVQEIAMAKQVHINYAGYWYDWNIFAPIICSLSGEKAGNLLQKLDIIEGMTVPNFQAIGRIERLNEMKNLCFTSEKPKLEDVVLEFFGTQSTLDQDRIFAFQGITKAADEKFLEPNYELTTLDVFEKLAVYALKSNNPFRIFSAAGIGYIHNFEWSNQSWPSWITNWKELSERFHAPSLLEDSAPYRAAGYSRIEFEFQQEDHSIKLRGICLGLIHRVAIEKMDINFTVEDLENVGECENNMEQKMLQMAQRQLWRQKEASRIAEEEVHEYFQNGETRKEALWRTLLCNRSIYSYPAESSCEQDFQDFFRVIENAPKILSGDNSMALEGLLGLGSASDDMRDEISKSEGCEIKATPDETIDTIQKMLEESGMAVNVRQYLTAELLNDRPRLTKELVVLAGISSQNATVLVEAEKGPDVEQNKLSPEWIRANEELCVKAFSPAFTPDPLQLVQKLCLMYGWLLGHVAREQERTKGVLYQGGFGTLLATTMAQRQFAITDMGFMAMVPPETKPGDVVCVFLGAGTPHILRKVPVFGGEQKYQLVGEAYVHGFMDGQALAIFADKTQSFDLV